MEDYLFDEELHEAEEMHETIKCGAVQLNLNKLTFFFTCIYCECELSSLRVFADHFQHHLSELTELESELLLKNAEEDDEHAHESMNESLNDDQSSSNMPDNEDNPLRDYSIEMLDDTAQDNLEQLSNNENTADQYIYQVRVLKTEEGETQLEEDLKPSINDLEHCEIEIGTPDMGFDILPEIKLEVDQTKIKDEMTNYICEICGIKFAEPSTLRMHLQRHNRCQFCHMHFATKSQLKLHIKTHVGQKNFVCEECGQGFKNIENLKAHQRRHVTEQLYLCNTCGKSFYEERALRDHIMIHTSSRPFICKECNMTFSKQEALMLHASMHTDIRKFSCTICRMTFAQNSGLLSHMKEKHRNSLDTGE